MIRSLLVANRGEIAVRIVRAARERGIRTVAVYSEPDRLAPHVLEADEAYAIGPAPSAESYLRSDKLIAIAEASGAEAILVPRALRNMLFGRLRMKWLL